MEIFCSLPMRHSARTGTLMMMMMIDVNKATNIICFLIVGAWNPLDIQLNLMFGTELENFNG